MQKARRYTSAALEKWREGRWRARTDLLWLCNNILDMRDVSRKLNGVMIDRMQQFPLPTPEEQAALDVWDPKAERWNYTPLIYDKNRLPGKLPDPMRLPGKRRRLFLDSRSTMKTFIQTVAGSLQWITNYPDIAILIFHGALDRAEEVTDLMKQYFLTNQKWRALFPELCPPAGTTEWGTKKQFTVEGRSLGFITPNPTVRAAAIETGGAGRHVQVIKYTDIVHEDNSGTAEYCDLITRKFYASQNLLDSITYWIDVEGTRWNFSDAYGRVIDAEMNRQRIKKAWKLHDEVILDESEAREKLKQAEAKARTAGKLPPRLLPLENHYVPQVDRRTYEVYINCIWETTKRTFDYDDMEPERFQRVLGEDGKPLSRWPERWPTDMLLEEEERAPEIFSCQKMNHPIGSADGVNQFPGPWDGNNHLPALIKREDFQQNVRVMHYDIAVDFAHTVSARSDYTAMSVGAFDSYGRCYVVEIVHGKFLIEESIDKMFALCRKYRPLRLMLEKTGFEEGVSVWIRRKEALENFWLPITWVPRAGGANQKSKNERIGETLQPWWTSSDIRFLDDLGAPYYWMLEEAKRFPKYKHQDILDTLTDLFHGKPWHGRLTERVHATAPAMREHYQRGARAEAFKRRLMIDNVLDIPGSAASGELSPYYKQTGGF